MNKLNTPIDIREKEKTVWAWIRHQLTLMDFSFKKIAVIHNTTATNVARVKYFPCPINERRIADVLGLEPHDLWPHRYDEFHKPNRISIKYRPDEYYKYRTIRHKINEKNKGINNHETQD